MTTHQKFQTDPTGNDLVGRACACDAPRDHYAGEGPFTSHLVSNYRSQNQGTEAGTIAFRDAVERVEAVAELNQALRFPMDLLDYLAERVERHSIASRVAMMDLMRDAISQGDLQDLSVNMKATELEAARTFLVAAGIRPGTIAPCDFPTITRAYLAARSAAGHTFSARHDG